MNNHLLVRALQVPAVSFSLIALFQQLERLKKQRSWHGRAGGIIPYDFRVPTLDRVRDSCWNPYEDRIFMPAVFGLGWSINLRSLLENLRLLPQPDVSEEGFLMPGKRMKKILSEAREPK